MIPVESSQCDARCLESIPAGGLEPIPADRLNLQIVVPCSEGDVYVDLTQGRVQRLHSLSAG